MRRTFDQRLKRPEQPATSLLPTSAAPSAGQPAPATPLAPGVGHDFSRIAIHPPEATIQPKLARTTPGDAHEQEADQVAAQVMRSPAGQPLPIAQAGGLQLATKTDPAASQAQAAGQTPAPASGPQIEAEDVSRLLDELLDLWYAASRFGISDANLSGDSHAAEAFLVALGGNLVWAATSFLNPAAVIAIRIMSVGGATIGSGTYEKLIKQDGSVDICRDMAKDMLGSAYKQFGAQKADLTTQLLGEFDKWGLRDRTSAEHADMRRSYAWQFLYDPAIQYNDVRAMENSSKKDVEAIWQKFAGYWHEFQVFKMGQEYALHCYYKALVASGVADKTKGVKRSSGKVPEAIIRKTRMSGTVKRYEFPGGATVEKYPYEINGQFGDYDIHVPE